MGHPSVSDDCAVYDNHLVVRTVVPRMRSRSVFRYPYMRKGRLPQKCYGAGAITNREKGCVNGWSRRETPIRLWCPFNACERAKFSGHHWDPFWLHVHVACARRARNNGVLGSFAAASFKTVVTSWS